MKTQRYNPLTGKVETFALPEKGEKGDQGPKGETGDTGTFVDFAALYDNDAVTMAGDVTPVTIDTTQAFTFSVTVQWNNQKTGNSLSCTEADLRFLH